MVYLIILGAIILIGLSIATFTDFKTREVPDWLSYGLIAIGVGISLLFSFIYRDYWFLINSLAGFALFLIFALIMFYAGQWGGGDSKVLMGLGALIGLDVRFVEFPFLISFLINALLVGAAYGLIWSLSLSFRNWKSFYKALKKELRSAKVIKTRVYLFVFVFLLFVLAFFNRGSALSSFFLALSLMSLSIFYLWVFVKAIEKTCMIKGITPDKLTEGDWIVKDIKYKGKKICGPKDLGIEKKQIKELVKLYKQRKIKKVLIKEGIPFVPSFLIAYIVSLLFGNLLFLLV
jgi:Flp pilus assembly protein protease CpaA